MFALTRERAGGHGSMSVRSGPGLIPEPRNRRGDGIRKWRGTPAEGALELAAGDHPGSLGLMELLPDRTQGRNVRTWSCPGRTKGRVWTVSEAPIAVARLVFESSGGRAFRGADSAPPGRNQP